jgi:hypothetical protein
MFNFLRKISALALVIFISIATVAPAQEIEDLGFHLKQEEKISSNLGRFELSLGSQMLSKEQSSLKLSNIDLPIQEFNLKNTGNFNKFRFQNEQPAIDSDIESPKLEVSPQIIEENSNFSTLTLNNSYMENSIGLNSSPSQAISGKKKIGKWAVYGEYKKEKVNSLNLKSSNSSTVIPRLYSNITANQNARTTTGKTLPPSDPDKNAALSSRYHLEAVYNFLPTFKGKVSYKRSMIDQSESGEKLQVEGIVEANKNMLIKAGYNNEKRPEVNDPNATEDTKVWTEFILKF